MKQAKTKRKTPVIKKARAAYWDFKTEYDADFDDLPDLGIEFTVSVSLLRIAHCVSTKRKARAASWDYKTKYDAECGFFPDLGIELTVSVSLLHLIVFTNI